MKTILSTGIKLILGIVIMINSACDQSMKFADVQKQEIQSNLIDTAAMTVATRFLPNPEFEIVKSDDNEFGQYLMNLPLHNIDREVKYYNGEIKSKRNIYCSVIDQEIDPQDLQQCADAVMRLRGEYLFQEKKYADIHFNFLDGKTRYYKDYVKGDYSYKMFRKYMKYIFSYANTSSLHDELMKVENIKDIKAGDIFIVKGQPYGHAVIVLMVAQNTTGEKEFLLAQSYMPAQETQVLINPESKSPWFKAKEGELNTPEWTFQSTNLRSFK